MQAEVVERALETVLSSTAFSRAGRLRRFLAYAVHETLAGNGAHLKEYSIGADVFDRGADFDPRIDTIVRVEAIKLRQRLLAYYMTEGAADPVAISIPKGSYRPVFEKQVAHLDPILDDPEALYWHAIALGFRQNPDEHDRIIRLLMQGVARWPEDARLHSALAYILAGALCSDMGHLAPDEGVPLLQWAATRALALDPDRAEPHLYLSLAGIRRSDKSAALAGVRRALDIAPNDASLRLWAAATLVSAGKAEEALLQVCQAMRLAPGVMLYRTYASVFLFAAGRRDAAIGHLSDVLAFDPNDYTANFWLSRALIVAGRFDEAKAVAGRAYAFSRSPRTLSMIACAEAYTGNVESAEGILAELKRTARTRYVPRTAIASIHIASGRLDNAAAEIGRAAREGDFILAYANLDSRWAPLRGRVAGL